MSTKDFNEIEAVFRKRDRAKAARQREPEEYPDVPEFMNEPRRIHGNPGYSVRDLRDVHNGTAVYDGGKGASRPSASMRRAKLRSDDGPTVVLRRKKKHPFLRFLGRTLIVLLALIILSGALSLLLAKMPETDAPIGARRDGCCTVLLCGTDEDGTRTDTMMLLYLDRNGKRLRLLSLPRDTMVNRDNPVPKLNGAYGANGKGEKGMNALLDYVKDLVGYRPDGYLLLDLDCFAELVDAMGGVSYDVPMDMSYHDPTQNLHIDLKAGTQTLNGKEALWLVRYRSGYAMADLDRIRVQRDFLAAAVSQWKAPSRLLRLPYAALLLLRDTETDLSYRNLCWLALTLARVGSGTLESDTLPGEAAWVNGGAYYVEDREKAAALVNEKYNPYEKEITAGDLHPYGY